MYEVFRQSYILIAAYDARVVVGPDAVVLHRERFRRVSESVPSVQPRKPEIHVWTIAITLRELHILRFGDGLTTGDKVLTINEHHPAALMQMLGAKDRPLATCKRHGEENNGSHSTASAIALP